MSEEEKQIEIINKIRDSITDNENIYLLCDSLEDIIKNNKQSYDIQVVVNSLLNYTNKLQEENEKLKNYEYIKALIQQANDLKERINKLQKENENALILIEQYSNEREKILKGEFISKDKLKNILRKVQDYQLNYKDTTLFNIIMQELFGETEWTNLEDKENNLGEEETIKVLKQIRNSLYVDEYHYEWQLAIDSILGLYRKLQIENQKLKQEIKDITSIPEGDESYE